MTAHAYSNDRCFAEVSEHLEDRTRSRKDDWRRMPWTKELLFPAVRMHVVWQVSDGEVTLDLAQPIALQFLQDDDGDIVVRCRKLQVSGLGSTFADAIADFNENFVIQWEFLSESDTSQLYDDALAAKQALGRLGITVAHDKQ